MIAFMTAALSNDMRSVVVEGIPGQWATQVSAARWYRSGRLSSSSLGCTARHFIKGQRLRVGRAESPMAFSAMSLLFRSMWTMRMSWEDAWRDDVSDARVTALPR
jgi:hypothetical protein